MLPTPILTSTWLRWLCFRRAHIADGLLLVIAVWLHIRAAVH